MSEPFETHHKAYCSIPLHRHRRPYLCLVLNGNYEERSVDGRYRLKSGSLIYHPAYHAHMNVFQSDNANVLNLELDDVLFGFDGYRAARVLDATDLERLIRTNCVKAIETARAIFRDQNQSAEETPHWFANLVEKLASETEQKKIGDLAAELGVTHEHVSRRFRSELGVGPGSFRREKRIRHALSLLCEGESLATAAAASGFADQSHMGRVLKSVLGRTPGALRSEF